MDQPQQGEAYLTCSNQASLTAHVAWTLALYAMLRFLLIFSGRSRKCWSSHTHTNQTRHLKVIRDFQPTSAGVYFGLESNFWWRSGWFLNTGFHSSIKWHLKSTESQYLCFFQPPFWTNRAGGEVRIRTKLYKSNETFVHVKELSDHINCRCG